MYLNKISQKYNEYSKSDDLKNIVIGTYLIFLTLNLREHELWRDELQAWLIAKVSSNPLDVISNVRYEGRPPLWHEILWILSRLNESPDSMKILNFILISSSVILISRIKNINSILFAGLIYGFYFAYGYSTVSRDYTLILFLVSILVYLESNNRNNLAKISACFLLFTNIFGLMFSIGYLTLCKYRSVRIRWKLVDTVESFSFLILTISAIFLVIPPSDSNIFAKPSLSSISNFSETQFRRAFSAFAMPFLPFHEPNDLSKIAIVSVIFITCFFLSLQAKVFIVPIIIMLLINGLFGYDFYWWHKGVFLLAFLFALYLTNLEANKFSRGKAFKTIVSLIVAFQLLGTVFGNGKDFRSSTPYSNSKSAAEFVYSVCSKDCVLVSDNSIYSSSISAYLGGKPIYSLPEKDFVTYKKWKEFRGEVSWNALVKALEKYPKSLAIISTLDLSKKPEELVLLKYFSSSVWGDNYAIYKRKGIL